MPEWLRLLHVSLWTLAAIVQTTFSIISLSKNVSDRRKIRKLGINSSREIVSKLLIRQSILSLSIGVAALMAIGASFFDNLISSIALAWFLIGILIASTVITILGIRERERLEG